MDTWSSLPRPASYQQSDRETGPGCARASPEREAAAFSEARRSAEAGTWRRAAWGFVTVLETLRSRQSRAAPPAAAPVGSRARGQLRPWTAAPVDGRARWRAALRLGRGPCGARSCKYEATEGRAHLPVSPRTSSHAASPGVQAPREVMEGRGDPGALGVGGRFQLHSLGGHPQTGSVHPLLKTGPAELPR